MAESFLPPAAPPATPPSPLPAEPSLTLPAFAAVDVPEVVGSSYPHTFRARMGERFKRRLGDACGLTQFGVNLVTLGANGQSALRHWHSREDEFVYMLSGEVVLVSDAGEQLLRAGMCAGYPAGKADGHHLINRSAHPATYLEIGSRMADDNVFYPDDDLKFVADGDDFAFLHKDGSRY